MKQKSLTNVVIFLLLLAALLIPAFALETARQPLDAAAETRREASIFSWNLFLLNEGTYDAVRPMFEELHITRVYQSAPAAYLQEGGYTAMVSRLAADGIEVVALAGEREWGLPGSDLSEILSYIDAIAAYNAGSGANTPIRKLALDVETYTYSE